MGNDTEEMDRAIDWHMMILESNLTRIVKWVENVLAADKEDIVQRGE